MVTRSDELIRLLTAVEKCGVLHREIMAGQPRFLDKTENCLADNYASLGLSRLSQCPVDSFGNTPVSVEK